MCITKESHQIWVLRGENVPLLVPDIQCAVLDENLDVLQFNYPEVWAGMDLVVASNGSQSTLFSSFK